MMMLPLKSKPHVLTAELVWTWASCLPVQHHMQIIHFRTPPLHSSEKCVRKTDTYPSRSPTVGSCCLRILSKHVLCPLRTELLRNQKQRDDRKPNCLKPYEHTKGYSHSRHTTRLLCVRCRCQASPRWQSTTRWLSTMKTLQYKPQKTPNWLKHAQLTVSLATENSRSPSLLYLIWVMDLSWPWSRMGFWGGERTYYQLCWSAEQVTPVFVICSGELLWCSITSLLLPAGYYRNIYYNIAYLSWQTVHTPGCLGPSGR